MQFSIIAIVLSAAFAAAAPAPAAAASAELSKRTCGTLSGTALKVCQDACKVTCDAATGGLARKLCKAACDAGPLKVREAEAEAEAATDAELEAHIDAELTARGFGHKVCDAAVSHTQRFLGSNILTNMISSAMLPATPPSWPLTRRSAFRSA